jgi:hypothetical protein
MFSNTVPSLTLLDATTPDLTVIQVKYEKLLAI